jgi:hypothetical protein
MVVIELSVSYSTVPPYQQIFFNNIRFKVILHYTVPGTVTTVEKTCLLVKKIWFCFSYIILYLFHGESLFIPIAGASQFEPRGPILRQNTC